MFTVEKADVYEIIIKLINQIGYKINSETEVKKGKINYFNDVREEILASLER